MKITGPNSANPLKPPKGDRAPAERNKAAPPAKTDRVRFSPAAAALSKAREPEQPDLERIDKLRRAILDGSFKVDHQRIAERMLQEERELGGS